MERPSQITLQSPSPYLAEVNLDARLKGKADYFDALELWQRKLLSVQQAYFLQKRRAVIVFEGWDAAGKGGAIRRLTALLDPRGFCVYPISAPTPDEQGRHYLYRFQTKLPKPGRMAIFDRSYYGRVLVERVEAFATKKQWQRAYQEINEFERLLMDDGVRVIKLFIHIDKEEQRQRFIKRLKIPEKRWKLTLEDVRNREKWQAYESAIDDMFAHTSTVAAPWHVIAGNHKKYARVEVIKTVVQSLEQGVDVVPPKLSPEVERAVKGLF